MMNANMFYDNGDRKEPRNLEWFKSHHPDFYEKNFTDSGHLGYEYDYSSLPQEIKDDLDIYEGMCLSPYVTVVKEEVIYDGK